MAVAKNIPRRAPLTRRAKIHWAVSGVLLILTVIFGLQSWHRFGLRSSLNSGLYYYGSRQDSNAVAELKKVLEQDESLGWVRELLATIETERGHLDQAEGFYEELLRRSPGRATAHYGLGVVAFRRAVASGSENTTHLTAARTAFQTASQKKGCPEARIGLAHVDLLAALHGDQAALGNAREALSRIDSEMASPQFRREISLGGWIDFYNGRGMIGSLSGAYSEEARSAFESALGYRPRDPGTLVNSLLMTTWRLETQTFTTDQLSKLVTALEQTIAGLRNTVLGFEEGPNAVLNEPVLHLRLAVAFACMRGGLYNDGRRWLEDVRGERSYEKYVDPLMADIAFRLERLHQPRMDPDQRSGALLDALSAAMRVSENPLMALPERRQTLAKVYNIMGVLFFHQAMGSGHEFEFEQSRETLKKAVEQDPEVYEANRNLVVLLKKRAMGESPDRYAEAARKAAAAGDEERKQDWSKVDSIVAVPPKEEGN